MSGLKSQLSNLMPVAQACTILGEDRVSKIVSSLLVLQQQNAPGQGIAEETSTLVQSMLYTTNTATKPSPQASQAELITQTSSIPPPIRQAWKKLASRPLMLDKLTLVKFLVPASAQPHSGPGGHMGLFDCLAYALQTKPPQSSSAAVTGFSPPPLVAIPDLLIFLAICQNYWELQHEMEEDGIVSFSSAHPAVVSMAQWMFLVYDAYQKKGLLVRDTFHRFLSDVYGDESYQTESMKQLLDKVFSKGTQLTSREFVQAISDTLTYAPLPTHALLDWMASMAQAMKPIVTAAESTQVFLQTIDQQQRFLPQICDQYHLVEHRLYEIKRRFHSLVESSSTVIQGDPMSVEEQPSSSNTNSSTSSSSANNTNSSLPKHVIPQAAFLQAVCTANDEQGHGGYFPQSIAERVFLAVSTMNKKAEELEAEDFEAPQFWDLTHVLQFGGLCVRCENDDDLIKWILQKVFNGGNSNSLTKEQISEMIVVLCQHMDFRLNTDRSAWEKADDEDVNEEEQASDDAVSLKAANALGLLPDSFGKDDAKKYVPIKVLIDQMLSLAGSKTEMLSLDQLMAWHQASKDDQRMGPFMKELRLIASILFGVPPKYGSMEQVIISEVERRHKQRYPQTDVSRRGPRGTVWYLIDDLWYRTWSGMIKKISFSPEDGQDLRDKASENASPRRLGKISNRGLLRENGSLALRVDIKWRKDYEIVPPLTWSALQAWYDGGPPIYRSVVPYIPTNAAATGGGRQARPTIQTENEIELYPFFVTMFLCDAASRGEARPFQQGVPVSRVSPVQVLLVQLCKEMDVDPDMGRLWVMESAGAAPEEQNRRSDWLLDLHLNIVEQRKNRVGDHGGNSNITLLLELKDRESELWPRGIDGKEWTFKKNDPNAIDIGDGIVGLYNMGNTCYLNSSIQCLSHTPIFRDYFTSKCYLNDINTTNPLGHQGHLAQVSAVLINSLWKRFNQQGPHQPKRVTAPGSYAPVRAPALTPKTFKDSLGKFNEHFAGNEQHDAQELLAFLLGGLSEDLNRIVEKPYIQAPDSDGRPDSELADIWWSNHLKREMSIIVALFTGQYKSLLKCKSCKYESARFEPFSFLQVPLPEDDTIPVSLVLYPRRECAETTKYSIRVHNNGTLYDVLLSLAKVMHTDEELEGKEEETSDPPPESTSEVEKEKLKAAYAKRAQNMAVVDMREGYIFKIAPNAWRLPDLQNKDTGELPLLHVYELDPMPEDGDGPNNESFSKAGSEKNGEKDDESEKNAEKDDDISSNDNKEATPTQRCSFLALAQRRSELVSKEVLHPLTHGVFGTPLLLRVTDLEGLTGRQLYDFVAKRLRNFVPKLALKFLEDNSESSAADSGDEKKDDAHASDKKEGVQTKAEIRQQLRKTLTDMEEVAAGHVPRYGFRLRMANRDGRRCALCPWYDCCIGCLVPDDDAPTVVMCGDSVVIDWHFAVDVATNGFGTRASQVEQASSQQSPFRARGPGVSVKNHISCGIGAKGKGYAGAITLEDCLDAFAREEKIPEAYCSKCKDFRVQTKRMSLWRLPPVVIIHLKRFQFTQHMRRKLRDFVHFPVEGLDLSRIMAQDCSNKHSAPDAAESTKDVGETAKENGGEPTSNGETIGTDDSATAATDDDSASASLKQDSGRKEMLYDLYGVVHHQGALSTGHYVASLKSEIDGQWRLFNDAQMYEIHSRDVVDSSAYILFYIRRDVKNLKLSDFWDTSHRAGEGFTEEEMNKLISGQSDRCVIS